MSDTNSAYAALISNISERDRTEDVEQFDDIRRHEQIEDSSCITRDEEKSRQNMMLLRAWFRFRGTTKWYDELLIAKENIIDKVATVPTASSRKIDTSAPMEIETNESWISHCVLSTRKQAKGN